jgi:hypothetical protein
MKGRPQRGDPSGFLGLNQTAGFEGKRGAPCHEERPFSVGRISSPISLKPLEHNAFSRVERAQPSRANRRQAVINSG